MLVQSHMSEEGHGTTEVASVHHSVLCSLSLQGTCRRTVPTVPSQEVIVGSLLGKGSFSEVFDVSIRTTSESNSSVAGNDDESTVTSTCDESSCAPESPRKASRTNYTPTPQKYALKSIKRDLSSDKGMIDLAIRDAYCEAEILSHLPRHENMVSLVAVSDGFWQDPRRGFVILEKVCKTLDFQLFRWSLAYKSNDNVGEFQFKKRRRMMIHQQRQRIESCAVGVANAVKFLHGHKVIHRDLKPSNVGFGHDGKIKLFDFGLARSTQVSQEPGRDRRMTGDTGTPRYMAPEVQLHQDYTDSADVYSFAILLWEICALEKPYGRSLTSDSLVHKIARKRHRPPLRSIGSPAVKELLKACWDPDPSMRPGFPSILQRLGELVNV